MIMEGGQPRMTPHGPEIVHVFLPVSEITIHDTWQVSGLCGTGSHDFSVTEVRVPERRIFALLDPAGHRSEPLYQMPPLPLYVFQLACVSLGIARGALDEFTELAKTKVPTMHQDVLAERPMAQVELARAETALGSARGFLHEMAMDMWESVRAGRQVSTRQIAISRAAATQAAETALAVTQVTNRLAGGGSIYATSALQRHARDAEAVTHHFTVAPHTWENAGRLLFGRKTIVPVF
jgi:alkylation response protein AidB-like acyl-CoA dehydrogenase